MAAYILHNLGGGAWLRTDLPKAEDYIRRALAMRQKLAPGTSPVAESLQLLALVVKAAGRPAEGEEYLRQALAILEKSDPQSLYVALTLQTLGSFAQDAGDLGRAEEYYRRGLAIGEKHPPSIQGVALNLSALGGVALARGDFQKAEEYYRRALAVREIIAPNSVGVARNLNMLAEVVWRQGDLVQAEKYGLSALSIVEKQVPGSLYAAEIYREQGLLADARGDLAKAEEYLRKAVAIYGRGTAENVDLADNLNNLGQVAREQGDLPKAEELSRRALAVGQRVAPAGSQVADSLALLGNVAQDQGDWAQAKEYDSQALAIREKLVPGSVDHVESLASLAAVMRHSGQLDAAAELFDRALSSLESQIARAGGTEEKRSSYRAQHSSYYRDYIDLLLAQKKPELAFQVLERSRARSLLEMLAEANVDIRKGVDPSFVEQERSLQADMAAKSERRVQLLTGQHTEAQLAAVDKEIHELVAQYDDLKEHIRAKSPTYAALTQPQPVNVEQVQKQLLDDHTVLLEYSLGKERSYVFAVTPVSLDAYELPKQGDIENLARKLHELLATWNQAPKGETGLRRKTRIAKTERAYERAVAKLGQTVLGPVASQMQGKRLLIVSDGALQYIPFSILPDPTSSARPRLPLMTRHEIVNLPSASVLAVLRQQETRRPQRSKAVAVLADPVFSARDARVVAGLKPNLGQVRALPQPENDAVPDLSEEQLTRAARDVGMLYLPRLRSTRREAEAIMAATPASQGLKALDFQANRELSMSPELRDYRIVHFATHGLVDSEHPELSGLVLSLVNKQGRSQNGFLGLEDIYNLDLPVDMVVLSACKTGLGKQMSGEGLIGLTRGFMYAGASRVVASLWSVDDVATAELMKRFYKGMLRQGLSPAAALHQAQMQMRKQEKWSSPYYWGAFVIEGEWKPEMKPF
jgi:CHAT domain-containing protein/Tfp pilus assembly protein PilF